MKKTRRRYDREFKISVVAELESGKPLAQIAREYGVHPSLPSRWRDELAENPERAFSGNGNRCIDSLPVHPLGAFCTYLAPYTAIEDDIDGARAMRISVQSPVQDAPVG